MGTQNRSYANRPKFSPPVTIKVLLAFLGEGFINQHHRRRFTERGTEMVGSFSQLLTKHSCGEFPHCRGFQWKGNFCFGGFCLLPTLRSGPGSGMQLGGGTQFCQSSIQISMVVPPRFCNHTLFRKWSTTGYFWTCCLCSRAAISLRTIATPWRRFVNLWDFCAFYGRIYKY